MKNEVYLVDNMEFMKDIPDNYYELAIVDPPYGIQKKDLTGFKNKKGKMFQDKLWIDQAKKCQGWDKKPDQGYFNELFRISKNQIIWGMQYFTTNLKDFSQVIIWDKQTGDNYFADAEVAYCSIKGTARIFSHQWCGAFKASERNIKSIHVNQKPIALYKWLLQNYAKPNDKIFDSHVGSGSSRIACYELGFHFEGCELDKDYHKNQELRFYEFKKKFHNEFYIPDLDQGLFKGIE